MYLLRLASCRGSVHNCTIPPFSAFQHTCTHCALSLSNSLSPLSTNLHTLRGALSLTLSLPLSLSLPHSPTSYPGPQFQIPSIPEMKKQTVGNDYPSQQLPTLMMCVAGAYFWNIPPPWHSTHHTPLGGESTMYLLFLPMHVPPACVAGLNNDGRT